MTPPRWVHSRVQADPLFNHPFLPTRFDPLLLVCPDPMEALHWGVLRRRSQLFESFRSVTLFDLRTFVLADDRSGNETHAIASEDRVREISRKLQYQVKTSAGIGVKVMLTAPVTLERSSGKACHAIDRRPPEQSVEFQVTTRSTH